MTYTHKTNLSFSPPIEFWRPFEHLFQNFLYRDGGDPYLSEPTTQLIKYYEKRTKDSFDVSEVKYDIYDNAIYQKINLATKTFNYLGLLIKYLSNCIENPDMVYKFQHFFESMYYFLKEGNITSYGLGQKSISVKEYINYFNTTCRKYGVPFVMFTQNDECFVVHITDIFIEKVILELPKFLSHPELATANKFFTEAYKNRDLGKNKDCLANIREGMESVRDYIYAKYPLTTSGNLHNDMQQLFDTHSSIVFDFTKIPESDPKKLKVITDHLRDSVLLAVKLGNFGHHKLVNPNLIEENTSLFSLGLVASIIPYILYIIK